MATLVLLRHGESNWNRQNLFTGWTDVDLSDSGREEARLGGRLLREEGLLPDVLHTSLLRRAIHTAQLALDEARRDWIPVVRTWRLNERHYGDLQGKNKEQTRQEYGDEQYMIWRRSYDTPPPALDEADERHPRHDERYGDLPPEVLPATECLADVLDRVLPWWEDAGCAVLAAGKVLMVAAHGNSLRALIKHLDGLAGHEVVGLNVPTGVPLVYELDDDFHPTGARVGWAGGIRGRYLGDEAEVRRRIEGVAAQGGGGQPGDEQSDDGPDRDGPDGR